MSKNISLHGKHEFVSVEAISFSRRCLEAASDSREADIKMVLAVFQIINYGERFSLSLFASRKESLIYSYMLRSHIWLLREPASPREK